MPSGAMVNFALDTLSAFVALLTSYYAYRANRLVRSSVLGAISLGFMLLGIGLAVDAGTTLVTGRLLVDFPGDRVLTLFSSYSYLALQMVAYFVIAVGYGRAAYGKQVGVAAAAGIILDRAPGLFLFTVLSYFVTLLLLAFVVFQGLLLRSEGRGRFSPMVMAAFGLILLAHIVLLLSVIALGPTLFLIGTGIQFLGFLSLLAFVVRSEVVGPR